MGEWQDNEKSLLSFKTPQLGFFEEVNKKALYISCVKASNANLLSGLPSTKWIDFFGAVSSPRGCWRSLYKRPIDKRTLGAKRKKQDEQADIRLFFRR